MVKLMSLLVVAIASFTLFDSSDGFFFRRRRREEEVNEVKVRTPFEEAVRKRFLYEVSLKTREKEAAKKKQKATVLQSLPFRWENQMLYLINKERTARPLKWSKKLQTEAQTAAESCEEVLFQDSKRFSYSVNRYRSRKEDVDGVAVVQSWKALKSNYYALEDMCLPGKQCSAYRNMVRADMRYVGCAKRNCGGSEKKSVKSHVGGVHVVCYFTPYSIV